MTSEVLRKSSEILPEKKCQRTETEDMKMFA